MPESYEYWVAYGGAVLNWPEASWLRVFVEGVVIVGSMPQGSVHGFLINARLLRPGCPEWAGLPAPTKFLRR